MELNRTASISSHARCGLIARARTVGAVWAIGACRGSAAGSRAGRTVAVAIRARRDRSPLGEAQPSPAETSFGCTQSDGRSLDRRTAHTSTRPPAWRLGRPVAPSPPSPRGAVAAWHQAARRSARRSAPAQVRRLRHASGPAAGERRPEPTRTLSVGQRPAQSRQARASKRASCRLSLSRWVDELTHARVTAFSSQITRANNVRKSF